MAEDLKTALIKPIYGNSTFILILSKDFAVRLKISNKDYVKCHIESERVIVEKTDEVSSI